MTNSIKQFQENIEQVKALGLMFSSINNNTTSVLDSSGILRAEMVMAVSALDFFIHELVKEKMLLIYLEGRQKPQAYEKFAIPLSKVTDALSNSLDAAWLEDQIQTTHGYQSFQKSDKISCVLKLISDKSIWCEVADILNKSQSDITRELNLIVTRRNQIVHQADRNPTYPSIQWPIDEQLVNNAISHIENVCNSIYRIMSE